MKERIGYIRELTKSRIGRIYPKGEVRSYGYKAKAKTEENE